MEANTAEEGDTASTEQDESPEIWAEIKRGTEGVSATVYKSLEDGAVDVVDETWWSWAEFTGITTQELPISRGGTTRLDAAGPEDLLTAETVYDTIDKSSLSLSTVDPAEARKELDATL